MVQNSILVLIPVPLTPDRLVSRDLMCNGPEKKSREKSISAGGGVMVRKNKILSFEVVTFMGGLTK